MAAKSRRHFVDGHWTTVKEVAAELGITPQQIYQQMNFRGVGLQVVVNMYRENFILHGQGRAGRHMVDGRWTTIRQASEQLGVNYHTLYGQMDQRGCTLAEAVEAYRSGEIRHGGSRAKHYRVGGRMMTVAEAAERLGVSSNAIHVHMHKHKVGLAGAVRYYERKKQRAAEQAILKILMEG